MKQGFKKPTDRRLKKILFGCAAFMIAFTLVGFFAVPPLLKSILINQLSKNLHRDVSINKIRLNPYTLSIKIEGFQVKERTGAETFVSFDEMFLNLQSRSLIRRALVLREINLKNPYLKFTRLEDGSYNFSDLMEKKAPPPEKGKKPLHFSLNNIKVERGNIDFEDRLKQVRHRVSDLALQVPFVSNIPYYIETSAEPALSLKINGSPYALSGKTKVFAESRETAFDIHFTDLNIPHYLAYLPIKLNFRIPSALMDTKTSVAFVISKDKKPSIKITGDVTLKGVAIDDEKNNPLVRLPRLDVSIASVEPLLRTFHLSKMVLQSPELNLVRNQAGMLNIESRFPRIEERVEAIKKGESPPTTINADEIELRGGKVTFSDHSQKEPFKTILSPIDLKVDHFSNGKDKKSGYTLTLKTEANENIKAEGEVCVNPLLTEGNLEVKSVPIKKYSPYYSERVFFDIEDGRLNLSTRYRFAQGGNEPGISLSGLLASLEKIQLKKRDEGEPFVKIPILSVRNAGLDLTKKNVSVGEVSTEKGTILIKRAKDGKLNLQELIPPSPSQGTEQIPGGDPGAEKVWQFKAARVLVDQYTARFEDAMPEDPVSLTAEEIRLKAENLSTSKKEKGNLTLGLRLNQKGTISFDGSVGLQPLFADLKLSLKEIPVNAFQPYFTDRVKMIVQDGGITATGLLSVSDPEGKGLRLTYEGDSAITHFASIDRVNAEDFLKWESLALNQMDVGINPLHAHLGGIALTDFYARVVIYPDGTINLQNVFGKKEESKGPPAGGSAASGENTAETAQETAKDITIGLITLQGGTIDFTDNFIKPNYSVNMVELAGRISGLSPEEVKTAEVDLRGRLEGGGPLEIEGKVNPLSKDLLLDLNVKFNDIELSPMTPYSGKYVGYTIEKGKVSMDLRYLIVKRKLESQNRIFFDQLTLGDRVESPGATKLPVKLAISLLKDPKGEIRLDLPVGGSLDDPKFSVFGVVMQIIGNLLVKAATSPFALLGAMFGGGEHLEYLEFDYGSVDVKGPNENKVGTLIKILQQRPGIKLDMEGHVDLEKDKEGLRQLTFDRKLKAQKVKEMAKKGQSVASVDEVTIESAEYPKYLKMAYKEEKFPKPKTILGLDKDIPVPEMEKLMMAHIVIEETDLRSLASHRAAKVRDALLKAGIESERVFIVGPKSLAPEKKENLKDSRINFKIR